MKILRIEIKHGDLIIPRDGGHFIDADNTQVIEMAGEMNQIDGEQLGKRIAIALAAVCPDAPDKEG